MQPMQTMIAKYNATLPTVGDGCAKELQLTSSGVLLTTVRDSNGAQVIVSTGTDVSGGADRGFIAYGIDANDLAQPLSIDSNGYLTVNISAGTITVDFTPGTDYDEGSDEAGAQTEPGVISGITGSYVDIVTIALTSGSTLALEAFDASSDQLAQFQLVVESDGPTQYIRTMLVTENLGTNQLLFPRPKEITATDANTVVVLKAKALRYPCTIPMTAAGGINAYLKPE